MTNRMFLAKPVSSAAFLAISVASKEILANRVVVMSIQSRSDSLSPLNLLHASSICRHHGMISYLKVVAMLRISVSFVEAV